MGIKKLLPHRFPTTKFSLQEREALLILALEGGASPEELCCVYLQAPTTQELHKLWQFESVKSVKYIGDELLFQQLQELKLPWPDPLKTVFTDIGQEVVYYSPSGKVRFKRSAGPKNVLIVDDSKTIQKLLVKIVEDSPRLKVVGVAGSPSEARAIIESSTPIDLVTLDIHMPEMNGVDFLKTFLGRQNIPTVMISSVSLNEGPLVMEALSSGASTYIQKPSLEKLSQLKEEIIEKLEAVAWAGPKKTTPKVTSSQVPFQQLEGLIAIGSSTGGTQALQEIFTALPDSIPPVVVVQHIPAVFSKALADRLNTLCPFLVKEAEEGEFLRPNTVYIAPGGQQMKLLKRGQEIRICINDDPPLNRFRPSVDYLFNSLAALQVERLMGVILTGMGKDGAKGLLALKNHGAMTIAQDEESSIVFGMPREAIALGAAQRVVSLSEMASAIPLEFNKMITLKSA